MRVTTLILLPTEIQLEILSQVSDIHTLKAVAASCHSLRDLLLHPSNLVIKQVLERIIPPDLLSEAFAVYKSTHLPPTNQQVVGNLLYEYFVSLRQLTRPWSLNEAAALEQFHELVQLLSTDFVTSTLSKHPVTGSPEKFERPPTERELRRIQRGFYRFELYSNLFKKKDKRVPGTRPPRIAIPLKDQSRLFFDQFSPREIEQLGCIHDFLLRVVDEAFDDVAAHDVDWGECGINYYEGYKAGEIGRRRKHYLSLGLKFIHRLGTTKDFQARLQILNASMDIQPKFLDDALLDSNMPVEDMPLSSYDEERQRREIRPPAIIDSDPGPAEVWRATHLDEPGQTFAMADDHIPLRERGYVMWDQERLAKWGLLNIPWQRPPRLSLEERRELRAKIRRSHERRTEIWRNGGSGWWSEYDESQVVY